MAKVKFLYYHNEYVFNKIKEDLKVNDLLIKYKLVIDKELNELYFSYKSKNLKLYERKIIKEFNSNNIIINVFNLKKNINNNELNHILCPICENLIIMNINDDKLSIDNCINNHNIGDLTINEFMNLQKINKTPIKCDICGNNLSYYHKKFFICSCKKYICPLCNQLHKSENFERSSIVENIESKDNNNEEHDKIEYIKRFSYCYKHNLEFKMYCHFCKKNLCYACEVEHSNHKRTYFKKIIPDENKIKDIQNDIIKTSEIMDLYDEELNLLNHFITDLIFNLKNNIIQYKKLFDIISNSFNYLNNYETIMSIMKFKTKSIKKEINNFLSKDIKNRFNYLIEIYNNTKNEMTIIYKIIKNNKNYQIKLFGDLFVQNNKNNCSLIINGKKQDLCEYYKLDQNSDDSRLIIKLIEKNVITNMSHMFMDCQSLLSIPDLSKWNIKNVTNISHMFSLCSNLDTIPDISKWNTINIKNMSYVSLVIVVYYLLYRIFHYGIQKMLIICLLYFIIVNHYYICLIFQNGILLMLLI